MAIAFDNATNGGTDSGTSITFSHTCNGSDRFLVVACIGQVGAGADDVTGATYGGVAMTLIKKFVDASITRFGYFFALTNPASGANNVIVSCSNPHFLAAGAASYTGVSQTGQPEAQNDSYTDGDADGLTQIDVTALTADAWAILGTFGHDGANGAPSAVANITRRTYESTFGTWGLFDSNGAVGAVSFPAHWQYTNVPADIASILISVAAASAGNPTPAAGALSIAGQGTKLGFTILMPDEV